MDLRHIRLSFCYENATWWTHRFPLKRSPQTLGTYLSFEKKNGGKELGWQERVGTVFIRESLGDINSHLGGRGKTLKLILLFPPFSFLLCGSQAKAKTSPGSPVPSRDTTGTVGRASGDKRGRRYLFLGVVAISKITTSLSRAWSQTDLRNTGLVGRLAALTVVSHQGCSGAQLSCTFKPVK